MPGDVVCMGAQCRCNQGVTPSLLNVTSQRLMTVQGALVATVMDCVTAVNVMPFGICQQLTKLASGIPTPCVPVPVGKWTPGSKIESINKNPILTKNSTLSCGVGGKITIANPNCKVDYSTK